MSLRIAKHQEAHDSDGYGYAINVKHYGRGYSEDGTDAQRESAEEYARETWWNDAHEIAKAHGFDGVYSLGRSGGWCAPYYENRRYVHVTEKELAELGDEATDEERDESKRFATFAADIEALYNDFPASFADELARIIEQDETEAREEKAAGDKCSKMQYLALELLDRDPSSEACEVCDYWRKQWGLPTQAEADAWQESEIDKANRI